MISQSRRHDRDPTLASSLKNTVIWTIRGRVATRENREEMNRGKGMMSKHLVDLETEEDEQMRSLLLQIAV